ncbi:MAG: peptidoglycan-binding domain-containing protein [Anderseniella sp.]|uniref:peptidoglycan-binding domain-containing protein n=1 Tax=Parasphingorhabdus sp. TaxID=2709688 RepID=UPI0032851855
MNQDYDDTDEMREPRHGVLIVGAGLAAVLAGSVWMNLLSGEHAVFERTAAAPAPVIEEVLHEAPAGRSSGYFPSARVNVEIKSSSSRQIAEDPLAQLILQTENSGEPEIPMPPGVEPEPSLVLLAQRELASLGLYYGVVDGLAGADTRDAVRKYQALNGLAVTGAVTRPVLDHIQFARRLSDAGNTSIAVHQVQSALAKLGYSPGKIDGQLGEQTKIAIRTFEADRGWPVTGEVSDELLQELQGTNEQASIAIQ